MKKAFIILIFVYMAIISYVFAADKYTGVDDLLTENPIWHNKVRDLGDSTYALSVINEGAPSAKTSCSSSSHSTLSTLVTTVNSTLSGSSNRLHSIAFFSDGALTPTFYAVICQVSN